MMVDLIPIERGAPDKRVIRWVRRKHPKVKASRLVIHSTSWRYEAPHFILTYLAYSDDFDLGDHMEIALSALPSPRTKRGASTARVVAHALRHLAFLSAEDPRKYRPVLDGRTRRALAKLKPAAAGRF